MGKAALKVKEIAESKLEKAKEDIRKTKDLKNQAHADEKKAKQNKAKAKEELRKAKANEKADDNASDGAQKTKHSGSNITCELQMFRNTQPLTETVGV